MGVRKGRGVTNGKCLNIPNKQTKGNPLSNSKTCMNLEEIHCLITQNLPLVGKATRR